MLRHELQSTYRQNGVALIAGMVILLVLTLLSVAAMRMGSLQERMTHNLRESTIALNGAESALLEGETWIAQQVAATGGTPVPKSGCGDDPCDPPVAVWATGAPDEYTAKWINANGRPLLQADDMTLVSRAPHYIVEILPFIAATPGRSSSLVIQSGGRSGDQFFRVTAVSPGRNADTQAVLQTTYATRF